MVKIQTFLILFHIFLGQSVTLIFITKLVCHVLLRYGKDNPISNKENKTLKGNLPPKVPTINFRLQQQQQQENKIT